VQLGVAISSGSTAAPALDSQARLVTVGDQLNARWRTVRISPDHQFFGASSCKAFVLDDDSRMRSGQRGLFLTVPLSWGDELRIEPSGLCTVTEWISSASRSGPDTRSCAFGPNAAWGEGCHAPFRRASSLSTGRSGFYDAAVKAVLQTLLGDVALRRNWARFREGHACSRRRRHTFASHSIALVVPA